MKTIVKERVQGGNDPYSIYYYWDDPPQAIFDAGEPVWYRHDPTNLPPGAVFQVVVRLRLVPVTQPVSVGVMTDAGTVTTNIAVDANAPQIGQRGFLAGPEEGVSPLAAQRRDRSDLDLDGRHECDFAHDHGG